MNKKLISTMVILLMLFTFSNYFAISVLAAPGDTTLVSVASDGAQGDNWSYDPSISADGRFIAFGSGANNLVDGETPNTNSIFIHDRQTGETSIVSVASDGTLGGAPSFNPSISADGRFIAFESSSNNLVDGDTNGEDDIFVHDRQMGETSRVSVASDGTQGNSRSIFPSISADGRFIAFESSSNNLVDGDTNNSMDIFIHDRQTGETSRVSVASAGTQGNKDSWYPSISADGRFIAFESYADNLIDGDTNNYRDIFAHDRQTGETSRVSVASDGTQGNIMSRSPSISADGRFIAFESSSNNLVGGDTNNSMDIFVHDRQTGETNRVSVASDGTQGESGYLDYNYSSPYTSISADGRFIAFGSHANNLVDGDTNGKYDIFVHDRQTGETSRVSVASDGTQGNSRSIFPSISADGRFIAFESYADNLVDGDTNSEQDIFVHEVSWDDIPPTPTPSPTPSPTPPDPEDPNWLMMFYQAGDNNLSLDYYLEIRDIINVNNENIDIAIFQDSLYQNANFQFKPSDENITYFYDKGELNSADGLTLMNFVNWAKSKSNALHYALIISDHGHALSGVAQDVTNSSDPEIPDKILIDKELPQALAQSGPFDVLYMNTCLMANIEFIYQIRGSANYYVASESKAYAPRHHSDYLGSISDTTTPIELAAVISYTYYEEIKTVDNRPTTISAVDMSYIDLVVARTNELAKAVREAPLSTKAEIWTAVASGASQLQRFDENPFPGIDPFDKLADLYHLAIVLRDFPETQIEANALLETQDFIINNFQVSDHFLDSPIYWDHRNALGVTITVPIIPISFYDGEWLDFAQAADWSFLVNSRDTKILLESEFHWGPMISEMIEQFNPDGLDQSDPPELVAPISLLDNIYLPLIIK